MSEQPSGGDMTSAFASALESASSSASDASPASPPTTETPAAAPAEATAAATAQPVEETTETATASAEDKPKEPPTWRWQDILANTRKTVAEETEARLKQEYEQRLKPYEGIDEQTLHGYRVLRAAEHGDLQARAMIAQANPSLAQAMGWVQGQADPEPQPDAAIQMPDGSQVPVFTPEGMKKWQQWNQKQLATTLESQFTEKFKPLMSTAEKLQQLEQDARIREQSTQWATSVTAPLEKLPYYAEFKPELLKALTALPETATDQQMTTALYETYTRLHTAKLDELTKGGEAKALALQQQRAVASSPNPAAPNATTPQKFKPGADGFAAALQHYAATDAR